MNIIISLRVQFELVNYLFVLHTYLHDLYLEKAKSDCTNLEVKTEQIFSLCHARDIYFHYTEVLH